MTHVFISYSHHDRWTARRLAEELRARDVNAWLDLDSISAGSNWTSEIERALAEADTLVLLLSPDSVESDSVRHELEYAVRQSKPVLMVMVRDTPLPILMRNQQYIDARQDWDRAMSQLVDALSMLRPPPRRDKEAARREAVRREAARQETARLGQMPPPAPSVAPAMRETLAPRRRWRWRAPLLLAAAIAGLALVVVIALQSTQGESMVSHAGPTQLPAGATTRPTQPPAAVPPTQVAGASNLWMTLTAVAMQAPVTSQPDWTRIPNTPSSTPSAVAIADADRALEDEIEARVKARIDFALAGTVVALRATDESSLSLIEAGQIAAMIAEATGDQQNSDTRLLLAFALGMLTLALVGGAGMLVTRGGRPFRRAAHHATRAHPPDVPVPLPEDYQVFVSSSDQDKAWVGRFVRDLGDMGYQVWWYAKDAPGLPFGQEIVRAIFYTKVFVVIVSPDSMTSKHVEEEIRLADRYDRPIITVIHRPTDARLYGLAKSSDIDFSDDRDYMSAMEFLTQAINRLLERHRMALQDDASAPLETSQDETQASP